MYVIFLLDRLNGSVIRVRELEASTDAEAIEIVSIEQWRGSLELWDGRRKLLRLDAHRPYGGD